MGILNRDKIIERLKNHELLINADKTAEGEFDVEPASYDLRAGRIIWKEYDHANKTSCIKEARHNPYVRTNQPIVTLQPGQVMFVITKEEVNMPVDLCGTVYAKNKFSRDGILALTTGHIDPGVKCPIVIRLINLRSIPFTFTLGEPIYTIVFQTLEYRTKVELKPHPPISMQDTISRTIESANAALGNALYDLSITHGFVSKEEFGKVLVKTVFKSIWGWLLIVFAILGAIAAVAKIIDLF